MKLFQIKPSKKRVSILVDGNEAGYLDRAWWPTTAEGSLNGQACKLSMPSKLFNRRWHLESSGQLIASATEGKVLGFIKTGTVYLIDVDSEELVLSRPHRDAFEWPLRRGEDRLGYVTVTQGWQRGTPLELDVELAEDLPEPLAPFMAYLSTRAFVACFPKRGMRID